MFAAQLSWRSHRAQEAHISASPGPTADSCAGYHGAGWQAASQADAGFFRMPELPSTPLLLHVEPGASSELTIQQCIGTAC